MNFETHNQCIKSLLNDIGKILDQVCYLGRNQIQQQSQVISQYIHFLKQLEIQVLFQWKTLQEDGRKALTQWKKIWIAKEKRKSNGFFDHWNELCQSVWNEVLTYEWNFSEDPWESYITFTFLDRDTHQVYVNEENQIANFSLWNQIVQFYRYLFYFHPDFVVKKFLNLVLIEDTNIQQVLEINSLKLKISNNSIHQHLQDFWIPIKKKDDWETISKHVEKFWENHSGGIYSQFPAFRLKKQHGELHLDGKVNRNIRFSQLVGIDSICKTLIQNIEDYFLFGKAHHVLLWGNRGTGKSSSVLALLHHFENKGVRLIEITQEDLIHLPDIYTLVENRPELFILFCDDISFEKNDPKYKHLKPLMEGSILRPANNLLIHATSNKRDLVEKKGIHFESSERKQLLDEQRAIDDRFGLKVFFDSPQFQDLTQLLFHLADKNEIQYVPEELKTKFHKFCLWNQHDSPAGRTVKQFIQTWIAQEKRSKI